MTDCRNRGEAAAGAQRTEVKQTLHVQPLIRTTVPNLPAPAPLLLLLLFVSINLHNTVNPGGLSKHSNYSADFIINGGKIERAREKKK